MNATNKTKKIAYVQQTVSWSGETRYFWSDNCMSVARGLERLGYEVRGFVCDKGGRNELPSLPISIHTPVKGNIYATRCALDVLGVPQPKNIDIPKSLMKYTNRKVWETTLGALRKKHKPVFVKSLEHQKAWCGAVIFQKSCGYPTGHRPENTYETANFPDSYKVLASEVINIRDEFRTVVLNGKIISTNADSPDYDYNHSRENKARVIAFVKKMIKSYGKNAPASYAIDVADVPLPMKVQRQNKFKFPTSELALIEVNDGFSAGNMTNLSDIQMAKICLARWHQIVGLKCPIRFRR
jgi:hypothetical protein